MQARVDASIWQQRVASTVLLLFAAMALGLTSLGTYAVTAHAVAAQRRDIAVRLALGASPAGIGRLVMRQWVTPVVLGALVGWSPASGPTSFPASARP
jgi:ABC-type antimicrobial peptide transport system permease subunit